MSRFAAPVFATRRGDGERAPRLDHESSATVTGFVRMNSGKAEPVHNQAAQPDRILIPSPCQPEGRGRGRVETTEKIGGSVCESNTPMLL